MARLSELRPGTWLFSQTLIFGLLTVAAPNVAHAAQDEADGWNFVVAPYLLVPHMNGDVAVRSIPAVVDVGPSEIFENLDFGAMLFLEDRIELYQDYYEKFGDAVSLSVSALFVQVERQLNMIMDLQIAQEMPLVFSVEGG